MKPFLLLFGLLLVVPVIGQEHPPTAAQCQADLAVWGDVNLRTEWFEAENGTPNKSTLAKLEYNQLEARAKELGGTCTEVDPQAKREYLEVANFYSILEEDRLYDFVARHHLMIQFLQEDVQGKR